MSSKVAIYVDVQNVYYTVKQAYGKHFNYRTFLERATKDRDVFKAIAYATDRKDLKQQGFQQVLRDMGFEVKLKPYIQRRDGSAKADWDVGITIDVLEYADDIDIIVLVSGDGDFDLLVKKMRAQGKTVEVYGTPGLIADSLINAASSYYPISPEMLL